MRKRTLTSSRREDMASKHPPAQKKSPDELRPGYYNANWDSQPPG